MGRSLRNINRKQITADRWQPIININQCFRCGIGPQQYTRRTGEGIGQQRIPGQPANRLSTHRRIFIHIRRVRRQAEIIRQIGERFQVFPLFLEDVMNTEHRLKLDEEDDHMLLILKMLYVRATEEVHEGAYEHFALLVSKTHLLTLQEQPGDFFGPIRERLRAGNPRIRNSGTDYLAYALIDAMVDNYTFLVDDLEEQIETIETRILERQEENSIERLHSLQRTVLFINKIFRSTREIITQLQRRGSGLFTEATHRYLQDVFDHIVYSQETSDMLNERIKILETLNLGLLNQRTNDVVKLLTVYASIFLPLTFVTGLFGMNFQHIPFADWKYGFIASVAFTALIGIGLLAYFRRRGWF
ncbi:MAG: magnesium/cobalt transporter CorA [Bdellovibrionaceae bacterium]|nr:magnesium/cobalt transporter CorA [Pseudobdellovibrionaceae bacterium]